MGPGGGGKDVQQHGQDCRCEKDGGTAEAGGEHRADDGESKRSLVHLLLLFTSSKCVQVGAFLVVLLLNLNIFNVIVSCCV